MKKLDEPSAKQSVKTVLGGVLIDMENADTYGKKIVCEVETVNRRGKSLVLLLLELLFGFSLEMVEFF